MRSTACIAMTLAMAVLPIFSLGKEPEANTDLSQDIQILRVLGTGDQSAVEGTAAAARLRESSDCKLMDLLRGMKDATPIGKNWLLGIANTKYIKEKNSVHPELERFLADESNDPEARYSVFSWLTEGRPDTRQRLLKSMLNDSSPELRFAAVRQALEQSPDAEGLKGLLSTARHPNQVVEIINRLEKAGVPIDQRKHFGFLSTWKFIGPFDHVGSKNFEKAFPVERDWQKGEIGSTYDGKQGSVVWLEHSTDAKDGVIDLAILFNKEKGCIVYGVTEFESSISGPAELRMGCINGNRVWLNGELVMSNEVYHSSMQIDQYIEPIQLVKGTNRILVKICQNEQTENWAQDYQFQLRISDSTGLAITSN